MIRFLAGRLAAGALVLFIVATATFFVMHTVPGGPFDQEKTFSPEIKKNILAKYHLDQPVHLQYLYYMRDLARGDLGPSFKYRNRRIQDILIDTFPVSAQLGLLALLIGVTLGVSAGIVSAVMRDSVFDRLAILFASLGIAIPSFVLGALLIWLFAYRLELLPPALWEGGRYMLLPALTLGLGPAAYLAVDALVGAGGIGQGLRADGAGQGAERLEGDLEARAPKLARAGGDGGRAADRHAGHRLIHCRKNFLGAGHGPLLHHRRDQPRLPAHHGRDPGLHRADRADEHRG